MYCWFIRPRQTPFFLTTAVTAFQTLDAVAADITYGTQNLLGSARLVQFIYNSGMFMQLIVQMEPGYEFTTVPMEDNIELCARDCTYVPGCVSCLVEPKPVTYQYNGATINFLLGSFLFGGTFVAGAAQIIQSIGANLSITCTRTDDTVVTIVCQVNAALIECRSFETLSIVLLYNATYVSGPTTTFADQMKSIVFCKQ